MFDTIRKFAEQRPILFVVLLAFLQPLIAMPFVLASKILGTSLTPLRLIIPTAQSVFVIWFIWSMGWMRMSGLTGRVHNIHLLIYPSLVLFIPVLIYGTIPIDGSWVLFYFFALLATGISEEGFSRGIAVPLLLKHGKWSAVLIAAAIFSAGHLTNAFFEDFSLIHWIDKFGATFGFAVLYGALFLRTGNLLPLILLHTMIDFIYVISGTAGPFVAIPIDINLHLTIAVFNFLVGLYLIRGTSEDDFQTLFSK